MTDRTVFLVYGFNYYECPCEPIKAFASEADAQALLAEIAAYENKKPSLPDGASDEEFDVWEEAKKKWLAAHPAGDVSSSDGYSVMPLMLAESK